MANSTAEKREWENKPRRGRNNNNNNKKKPPPPSPPRPTEFTTPSLTGFQRSGHAAHEHRLPGIERHGRVQHEVRVGQTPRPYLHRFVLDGRRRHAQVQFVIVLNARVDQLLHRRLVLQRKLNNDIYTLLLGRGFRFTRGTHRRTTQLYKAGGFLFLNTRCNTQFLIVRE